MELDELDDEAPVSSGNNWSDYESGPYCQHWIYFSNCERVCARCGVHCQDHNSDGASCEEFEDS